MIVVYNGTTDTVKFTVTDSNGAPLNLLNRNVVVQIEGLPAVTATGDALGIATALITTAANPVMSVRRYTVTVDGTVTEEGTCIIRPKMIPPV